MLFRDRIYQRGKDLYKQKRIKSIEKIGNTFYAKVKGTHLYDVSVTLSDDGDVLSMSCDCPYAMDGNNCKHEAALCIALKKEFLNQKEEKTDVEVNCMNTDNEYINSFNAYYEHNDFSDCLYLISKDIKKTIRSMGVKCYTKDYDVNEILKLYDSVREYCDFMNLYNDLNVITNEIYKEFTNYKVTRNKFLKVFEEKIINDDSNFQNIIINCLNLLNVQNKITICLDYLHYIDDKNIYFDYLIKNYLEGLNTLDLSITKGLREIPKYKEYDIAKLYLAKECFNNGNVDEAIKLIETIKNPTYKADELCKKILKDKYRLNKSKEYLDIVLDILKSNERIEPLIEYVKDLKEIYGDEWSEYECEFYDVASKNDQVIARHIVECLKETDSPLYAIECINRIDDIGAYNVYSYLAYLKESYIEIYLYLLKKKTIDYAIKYGKESFYNRRQLYSLIRHYIYEGELTNEEIECFINEIIYYGNLNNMQVKELKENVGNVL